MAVIKCKMCGGDILFTPGDTYGTCDHCGSASTIPKTEDEQKLNRYNRANHFRRQCEFDKALSAYEKILEQDDTDAEAHWGAVLSRYGIEYVEDPATQRRIPTCHRVQVASVLADADYRAAVENAPDTESRRLYETQAAEIAEIQRGILAISANEKPYDVFICYKETDETGRRTRDSQWAQDVYYGLTDAGYKVFFSRITLEDKLGQQYEPYIFAAINSAKVMVVIGTKPQYFNAVWVKNEWSRYLSLMATDRKRLLIPCYRDMDPYDLPDELSALQSQDMSKIGFMQDLLRGVKKVLEAETPQPTVVQEKVVVSGGNSKIDALLKRGNMALEDEEWDKATKFFEEVLNSDAENAQAYLGEAMAQEQCVSLESFVQKRLMATETAKEEEWYFTPQESHIKEIVGKYYIPNYVDLGKLKSLYSFKTSYMAALTCRKEQYEKEEAYWNGHKLLSRAERFAEGELKAYIETQKQTLFGTLTKRMKEAEEKKEADRDQTYDAHTRRLQEADSKAKAMFDAACRKREEDYQGLKKTAETSDDPGTLLQTASKLKELKDYKDTPALAQQCETRAAEIRAQQEAEAQRLRLAEEKKKKRLTLIVSAALVLAIAAIIVVTTVIIPNNKYNDALELMNSGKYVEAYEALIAMDNYKDNAEKAASIYPEVKKMKLRNVKVGDYVYYGTYPKTKAGTDRTGIEWLVLAKNDDKVLLLSRYGLDAQPYNTEKIDVTWENCSLRKWLNEDFLNKAFTEGEKRSILTTPVGNGKSQGYSKWNTDGGNNTQDKIFLLSYNEANKYLGVTQNDSSNVAARVAPTEYAKAQDAWTRSSYTTADGKAAGYWWLRSPGYHQNSAAYVDIDGSLNFDFVPYDNDCVRPAFWLNLES